MKLIRLKHIIFTFSVVSICSIFIFLHRNRMAGFYGNYKSNYRINIYSYCDTLGLWQYEQDRIESPFRMWNRRMIIMKDTIISTGLSDSLSCELIFTNKEFLIVRKFPECKSGDTLFLIHKSIPYFCISSRGGIWVNGKKERIWTDNYFNFLKIHKKYEKGIVKSVEYEWCSDFKLLDR
jgi:hypothetical protein